MIDKEAIRWHTPVNNTLHVRSLAGLIQVVFLVIE